MRSRQQCSVMPKNKAGYHALTVAGQTQNPSFASLEGWQGLAACSIADHITPGRTLT